MPSIITPELNIINPRHPSEIRRPTEENSQTFKKIFDETKPDKEKEKECTISLWELPSHHFSLSQEEELDPIEAAGTVNPYCAIQTPLSSATIPQSTFLDPNIEALFLHMVDQIEILSSKQASQTTFFLNSAKFKNSCFYGTRITINEFSTAPKAFNIEIATSPTGLITVQTHQAALMRAFHEGDYKFSIGRLDLELEQADTPLVHRKESVSDEEDQAT